MKMKRSAEKTALIDKLGEEYFFHKQNGDAAAAQAKVNELFIVILDVWLHKGLLHRRTRTLVSHDEIIAAVSEFFINGFQRYDPQKGRLSHFLNSSIEPNVWKTNDQDIQTETVLEEDRRTHAITETNKRLPSLDTPIKSRDEDESDSTLGDLQIDIHSTDELDFIDSGTEEVLIHLTASMLRLPSLMGRKAYSEVRVGMYQMFFTAGITELLKTDDTQQRVVQRHERDIFRVFKLPFLDYYMAGICRHASEIGRTPLKPYGVLVEGYSNTKETPLPLPNNVYTSYFERVENTTKSESAVSQMRKKYENEFRPLLRELDDPVVT